MLKCKGVSLLEILISLLILSLLLLGFDAMQLTALRNAQSAYYFSVANEQLRVIVERLKVLRGDSYAAQLTMWNQQNRMVLPQGIGSISGNYPDFSLSISWGSLKTCNKNQIGPSGCIRVSLALP